MDKNWLVDEIEVPNRFSSKDELNNLLYELVSRECSDVFILGRRPIYTKIHSKKYRATNRVINDSEIKDLAELIAGPGAITDLGAGVPQNPSHSFDKIIDGVKKSFRFRVNMIPCLRDNGRSLTITIRNIPTKIPTTEQLGVDQEIIDCVRSSRQGMILCVGATGNGKSSTLAALIDDRMEYDPHNGNLVTFEDPIEFVFDRPDREINLYTPLELGRHIKSFKDGLKNVMRMAPDIVLVGEIRDYDTMHAAMSVAVSGHTLLSTLHANNIAETLTRMTSFFPTDLQHQARMDILQSLSMIVAQRLVPSTDGKRVALREYLVLDNHIKKKLLEAPNMAQASIDLTRQYGRLMSQHAEEYLKKGMIDQDTYDLQCQNYG